MRKVPGPRNPDQALGPKSPSTGTEPSRIGLTAALQDCWPLNASGARLLPQHQRGRMFTFVWKKFSGSYFTLRCRRL